MFGALGTIAVICQMIVLSFGYDIKIALSVGLFGCAMWIAQSIKTKDNWLLTTNAVVAGFAIYGIL